MAEKMKHKILTIRVQPIVAEVDSKGRVTGLKDMGLVVLHEAQVNHAFKGTYLTKILADAKKEPT